MMGSVSIIDFLRARLDEDERQAGYVHHYIECSDEPDHSCFCRYPAQLRADIAAKRRLIAYVVTFAERLSRSRHEQADWNWYRIERDLILRNLAAPYADHPDFNPEWQP